MKARETSSQTKIVQSNSVQTKSVKTKIVQTPVYKLKTKRQQITLANKAIQECTRNGVTDGQSVIIRHNMYNNACNGVCSVNKVYI